MELPLTENDLADAGVIEPSQVIAPLPGMPAAAVVCFFGELITSLAARSGTRQVAVLEAAHGTHPIYEVERHGRRLAVFHPGVGAPLAAGFLEEAIALGCRYFIAVGGAGALVPELVLGHAVVVGSAVRDEGTSFHYLPASRTVDSDQEAMRVLQGVLDEAGEPYVTGRSWTTDAMYRETRDRVRRRVGEGCLTVEMEASAFFAVARTVGYVSPNCFTRAIRWPVSNGRTAAGPRPPRCGNGCSGSPPTPPCGWLSETGMVRDDPRSPPTGRVSAGRRGRVGRGIGGLHPQRRQAGSDVEFC